MDAGTLDPTDAEGQNETCLGVNAGIQIGYDVTESVQLAVRGASFYVFADEDETSVLTEGIEGATPFDRAITVPITAELQGRAELTPREDGSGARAPGPFHAAAGVSRHPSRRDCRPRATSPLSPLFPIGLEPS
jgi:hypothetical protein